MTQLKQPTTVSELIEAFGGPTKFAAEVISKNPSTASEMKRSGSIHVSYWPKIIAAAPSFGIRGVTADVLMKMHVEKAGASQ